MVFYSFVFSAIHLIFKMWLIALPEVGKYFYGSIYIRIVYKDNKLDEEIIEELFSLFSHKESSLAHVELPTTVETVEAAIKKHKDFSMAMELNLHRIKAVIEAGESLISQNNIYSERIRDRVDLLISRSDMTINTSNRTPLTEYL